MRAFILATLVASTPALAAEAPPAEYVPAPAKDIPGYSETVFSCELEEGWKTTDGQFVSREQVEVDKEVDGPPRYVSAPTGTSHMYMRCWGTDLAEKSLRELAILRNTIHARYGWAGFRKAWLREYFQRQPWYKPDPKFSIKRLSAVDRKNAALIAQTELSFRYVDLERMREKILAANGKWWGDLPSYENKDGEKVFTCDLDRYDGPEPKTVTEEVTVDGEPEEKEVDAHWVTRFKEAVASSKDCTYNSYETPLDSNEASEADLELLNPEERIELGLISRSMGDFATDSWQRAKGEGSLDKVLPVAELRQLSLRDLRLLRNTIYARRGRPFKSKLLQEHFSGMPWYKPNPAYTDKRLTKNDQRNVALISAVEKEFGGALVDKDFQAANPASAEDVAPPIPYEGTA